MLDSNFLQGIDSFQILIKVNAADYPSNDYYENTLQIDFAIVTQTRLASLFQSIRVLSQIQSTHNLYQRYLVGIIVMGLAGMILMAFLIRRILLKKAQGKNLEVYVSDANPLTSS